VASGAGLLRCYQHSASSGASAAGIGEEVEELQFFDWKEGGLELRYEKIGKAAGFRPECIYLRISSLRKGITGANINTGNSKG
jgi:hypothetical protein